MTLHRLTFFPLRRTLLIIASTVIFLSYGNSTYAKVYVYERPDGSKLITDQKSRNSGYKLQRSYKTTPYRSSTRSKSAQPYFSAPIKSQYDALIVSTSLKYDLEPSFIKAVIHVESAFDRFALSHAGAMGLMQIMPETAANYQLERDQFNAGRNVEAGVQHMRGLMDRYNNDKELSLAAYNAGEGAVSRYDGVPPYEETENYIIKVMKLYNVYKDEI